MKKLLVTASFFTSTLLMATLSPEYSASVDSLVPEYTQNVNSEKEQKKHDEKSESSFGSSITNMFSSTTEEKHEEVAYNREVKIVKVLNYSDITNYQQSHKLLKSDVVRGSVTKEKLTAKANQYKATKVLIFVQNNIRYISYFAN